MKIQLAKDGLLAANNPVSKDDLERFQWLVKYHQWHDAKTYAEFLPHSYTLKKGKYNDYGWNAREYEWFTFFIYENGFHAYFGKKDNVYYVDPDGIYYYWVFPVDIDEENHKVKESCTLINRAKVNNYFFYEETTIFGVERSIKVKPKHLWEGNS